MIYSLINWYFLYIYIFMQVLTLAMKLKIFSKSYLILSEIKERYGHWVTLKVI